MEENRMLSTLQWDKPLTVNGIRYKNATDAVTALKDYKGPIEILLNSKNSDSGQNNTNEQQGNNDETKIYMITVKPYMTKKSTPVFDFMKKWNKDNPMPMRTMEGFIKEETKGMYKMRLRGVFIEDATHCSHCQRPLTNPVSKMYGIGPICGGHFHIAAPETMEEYEAQKDSIKKKLQETIWEGWVIKSAITDIKELERSSHHKKVTGTA